MSRFFLTHSVLGFLSFTSLVAAQTPSDPSAAATGAQAAAAASSAASNEELKLEVSFAGKSEIGHDETIELRLNRPIRPDEGKLEVLLGTTDLTRLFRPESDTVLRYAPKIVPLPAGDQELVVFVLQPEGPYWELARVSVRVLSRMGFSKAELRPNLAVGMKAQLAETHTPESNVPPRSTFQDFTLQTGLSTDHVRAGFSARSQATVVGASNPQERLRFAVEGDDAPKIDLSSYLIQVQQGPIKASLGQLSFSGNRHLIKDFDTRGTTLTLQLGSRVDLSFGAMNATNVVGFDNVLGMMDGDHSVYSSTLGLELLRRPGGLRLEASILDGSVQPVSGFNQGAITDAAKNRALGFRMFANAVSQRLRLEAGFTRSEFTNPEDPLLSQGLDLVPLREETRDARYLELSLDLLRSSRLTSTKTATVSLILRHEKVDPLFRSIGASSLQADLMQNQLELQGSIADIGVQALYAQSEDNLDDIPSILKTKTQRGVVSVAIPIATVAGQQTPSPLLPSLTYNLELIHQFGASIPLDGGFDDPSKIPDQLSVAHTAAADWRSGRWSFEYRLQQSSQDNRQPGRENADFLNLAHGITLGLTPSRSLSLSLDANLEMADNKELAQTDRTRRLQFNGSWAPFQRLALATIVDFTHAKDDTGTRDNENLQLSAQVTWNIPITKRALAQVFLGLNRSASSSFDQTFGIDDDRTLTTFNTGLNLSFF